MAGKRIRKECIHPSESKKTKREVSEDDLENMFSLLSHSGTLEAGLTVLLNTLNRSIDSVFLCEYLRKYPDCGHVLTVFEQANKVFDSDKVLLSLLCLEHVLLYTASSNSDEVIEQSIGQRLARTLLTCHLQCFYTSLSASKPDLLSAAALRVLTAIVMQGNTIAAELLSVFDFSIKFLEYLPTRNVGLKVTPHDSVRVSFIKFVLSFLIVGDTDTLRSVLELKRFVNLIFRGLCKDVKETIEMFLNIIKEKVAENRAIPKRTKVEFFNKHVLKDIGTLLVHPNHQESGVAELTFDLLLALATDSKTGINFISSTFFTDLDRTNNPALLHLLLSLSSSLDNLLAQQFIIKCIVISPDLLLPYLKNVSFSYDPKTSPNWIVVMKFVTLLFSSLPSITHLLIYCDINVVSKCHLLAYVRFCIPFGMNRTILSSGILDPKMEIKFISIKLIKVIVERAVQLEYKHCDSICQILFPDALLKELPDIKTLISMRQTLITNLCDVSGTSNQLMDTHQISSDDSKDEFNFEELLTDLLDVMYLYQRLCPSLLAQANFTISKIITDYKRGGDDVNSFLKLSPSLLSSTLCLLLEAPIDSLRSLIQQDVIEQLLQLLNNEEHHRTVIELLIKCLEMNCLLFDYHDDLVLLFDTLHSHLSSSYYDENDKQELIHVLPSVIIDIFKCQPGNCKLCVVKEEEFMERISALPSLDDIMSNEGIFSSDNQPLCNCKNVCPFLSCLLSKIKDFSYAGGLILVTEFIYKILGKSGNPLLISSYLLNEYEVLGSSSLKFDASSLKSTLLQSFVEVTLILIAQYKKVSKRFLQFINKLLVESDINRFYLYLMNCLSTCHESSKWLSVFSYLMSELSKTIKRNGLSCVSENNYKELCLIETLLHSLEGSPDSSQLWNIQDLEIYIQIIHDWNHLAKRSLKKRFRCHQMLNLLSKLIPMIYVKLVTSGVSSDVQPVPLEILYRKIWSFLPLNKPLTEICDDPGLQIALIRLLVTCAENIQTVEEFETSHYPFFLGSYMATTSKSDAGLLYLVFLYERAGISMSQFSPIVWGPEALKHYQSRENVNWLLWKQPTSQEIIGLFDKKKMKLSIEQFQLDKKLEPVNCFSSQYEESDELMYDPCFVLPTLSLILKSSNAVDCKRFVTSYCLSYIITATSSLCYGVRLVAYDCLVHFTEQLQSSRFREKNQLLIFMETMKNSITKENMRLPSISSAFFVSTVHILIYPDHPLFSIIIPHLLKKPYIDLRDIPLYSTLLHSSSPQYVLERQWMLLLLFRGLRSDGDYYLYKRKEVFPHIMTMYHSPFTSDNSKTLILQFFLRASDILPAVIDLVWDHGILSWLHDLLKSHQNKKQCELIKDILISISNKYQDDGRIKEMLSTSKVVKVPLYQEEMKLLLCTV